MAANAVDTEGAFRAAELRRLPASERDAILSAAAARAENEYRSNADLIDFEAFGQDDLHGTSTAAQVG
jgi:acyl-CoA reductase-like NAD-dependent aldehyde dehydrogenase